MSARDDSGKPYDLDGQLDICSQEYETDREAFWSNRTEGRDWGLQGLYGHAERVAAALLKDTHALIDHAALADEPVQFEEERTAFLREMANEINLFLRLVKEKLPRGTPLAALDQYINDAALDTRPSDDSLLKLVWERFCIHLAQEMVARLTPGANRILQLNDMVISGNPSIATLRFLRRVSRCFIWGFDPECVILCRGAIDTAFATVITDQICDNHGLKKAGFGHTLTNRIKAALLEGMIDEGTKNAAFRVNSPATEAAHRDPTKTASVLNVIKDTRDVLQRLLPNDQSS